ncbi:flagellar associated protein [Histomonas meleagridis]|uniref:flagellar associated protein n=1 Tax=Histomonas meleagridis TaxID=135588 RepID=UPI0035594D9F|nr:flagellar associated protein [Histomonas meleagridis]KAH0796178.1 flagellar associated protein [Histomonas meleagridis]
MIALDRFALRHFDDPLYTGAKITNVSKEEFMNRVNSYIAEKGGFDKCSVGGYAPFCRHVFIPNFTDARVDVVEITEEILPLIKSGYRSRRPTELAVLCRWIDANDVPGGVPTAKYLDLIFYSHEQLIKEADAMNEEVTPGTWDWGLISIKAQLIETETPMQPITAMRNALGVEYGGSSNPINQEEYQRSVDFWERYISIQ